MIKTYTSIPSVNENAILTEIDYFEGTHDILHDGDVSNDVFETILRYLEK